VTLIEENISHYFCYVDFSLPQLSLRCNTSPTVARARLSSFCVFLSLAAVAVTKAQESAWGKPEGRYSSSAGVGL